MAHRIQLVLGAALFASACGLDLVGTAADPDASVVTSPSSDASTPSDATPTPPSPPADCTTATTCAALALSDPAFTQVAFGDAKDPCPIGYDSRELIEEPKAQLGSCGCGPCVTTGSACASGGVQSKYSSSPDVCDKNGDLVSFTSGQCIAYSGAFISTYAAEIPPPPSTIGTCNAPGLPDRTKVVVSARRACTRRGETCAASMCSLPGSLATCLRAAGDQTCPASAPKKHLVGSDVTLACGACTCTPTATCGGTLSFWTSSSSCNGTEHVIQGGACTQVNQSSIGSLKWVGKVASEGCTNVNAAGNATAALKDVETVCCP